MNTLSLRTLKFLKLKMVHILVQKRQDKNLMIYQVEPDIYKIDQNYINSYIQSGGWITEGKVTK